MHPLVRANQELWNETAAGNFRSAFYDVDGFKRQPTPLDDVVRQGLGDVRGKRVLHLQCHFGMDTLRVALAGAEVTGVDFSPVAIGHARELAAETKIAAQFVESDIYELPAVLDGTFDIVFSSWGVIGWLPDLVRWGQIVARYVAPGGCFFLAEGHPTMWMFDNEQDNFTVKYRYFDNGEPLVIPATGAPNYAGATVTKTEYSWPHSLEEILMALLGPGLRLDEFREHRHTVWKAFPFLVETGPGRFEFPPDRLAIPLAFSLRASKPR